MEPTASYQAHKRALLRDKYVKSVANILKHLDSEPKAAYSSHELTKFGVILSSFDPENLDSLECNSCLFIPMSSKEFEKFSLDDTEVDGGAVDYYLEFDQIYDRPTNVDNPSPSYVTYERAEQIFYYLDFIFSMLWKKHRGGGGGYLQDICGWDHVQ